MSAKRKINARRDEPARKHNYQITFRTTRRASGAWSSLRGLCERFGRREASYELFEKVVLPAMRDYVEGNGYLGRARAHRADEAAARRSAKAAKETAE